MPTLKAFIRLVLGKRWLSNRVLFMKAILYRGFSITMTFLFSMLITQNISLSVNITLLDLVFKTLLYFIFDVSWNNMIKRA